MLTNLHLQNFKSWVDTGPIRLAPITGLFGANSSGKTSLIQALLLLKQTAESSDRRAVLQFGGPGTPVNLGDFRGLVNQHNVGQALVIGISWSQEKEIQLIDTQNGGQPFASGKDLRFTTEITSKQKPAAPTRPRVKRFEYLLGPGRFGIQQKAGTKPGYELFAEDVDMKLVRTAGRPPLSIEPSKCYGFPDQARANYQNAEFLSLLELSLEEALSGLYYLGPLRAHPERTYAWSGTEPADMGRAGEQAITAILAARERGLKISPGPNKHRLSLEAYVAQKLKEIGLITEFRVAAISEDSDIFQVTVRKTAGSPEVLITDVGFGVSQILPVIVLCYYVPEGSTVILEQPEIHLHPSVQAGLADVLIDAYRRRGVQVIVESHSEHFLRRLQRRIAEQELESEEIALYFCENRDGESKIKTLEVDQFGNINNWPEEFFGDQFGELAATQRARVGRTTKREAQ